MTAYDTSSNSRNDNVDEKHSSLYLCDVTPPDNRSLSWDTEVLSCSSLDQRSEILKCSIKRTLHAQKMYDKHSVESLHRVCHIQCTILVTLIAMALARALVRCSVNDGKHDQLKIWLRYVLELTIISPLVIVSVNIANPFVELIVLFGVVALLFTIWYTKCWQLAAKRDYEFGRRPTIFTLMRSSINMLTAVCILAIDFKSFPKEFRKSRSFGVGLMDVGIGVFVFSMGLVASRPRKFSDLRKTVLIVGCLLSLGLARTMVIAAIDYHQDKHEYGTHLNAFFTLGFTKFLATCFGFFAKNNNHLLTLGLVILLAHEAILQCGVWRYVMDPHIKRNSFISSNREGLCSLTGFIALYLLSQYLGKWLQAADVLNFKEIKKKLKVLSLISFLLWLLVILAIFVVGIARVTCNLGYVVWILASAVTILTFYLIVFNIVLDTLIPAINGTYKENLLETSNNNSLVTLNSKLPLVAEAVNFNGLTFFLLANVLTGCTNIYFATDEKTNLESVFILFIYIFLTTTFIFILYRLKIRIA